jgi:hypothetical protein
MIIANSSTGFFCVSEIKDRFIPLSNEHVFVLSLIIFIASNCIILPLVLSAKKLINHERVFDIFVFGTQLIIVSLVLVLFLQMAFFSYYMVDILLAIIYLASSMSIGILVISFVKLYSWFKLRRQLLILLYGTVIVLLIILTLISSLYISQTLEFLPESIIRNDIDHKSCSIMFSANKPTDPYNINVSLGSKINLALPYNIILILAFTLTWFTTVLILKEYSGRIGKAQYFILVSLPLAFFAFRYIDYATDLLTYLNLYDLLPIVNDSLEYVRSTPFSLVVEFSLLFGSLFFSIVFLGVYSKIPNQLKLKNSVLITALGMFLLFSSREIIGLFLSSYPPLGILTMSFMGISSYLFFYGIFSTARLISRNVDLKNKIFAKYGSDTSFLEKISSAENEQIVTKMVTSASKLTEDFSSEPIDTLNEDELRLMVRDIIHELKKDKGQRIK